MGDRLLAVSVIAGLAIVAAPLSAKTFRWANDGEVISMDPYARQETTLLSFMANIDEPLIERNKALALEPSLATEWSQTAPDVWRFKLRQGVPFDPAASRRLLAEAGYPEGFEVGMDCPNDRYVNDEEICQAVVAMLSRIGIKANLLAQTKTKFFTKINYPAYDTPFNMLGWTPATCDAHNMLVSLLHTRAPNGGGAGLVNIGGYSNKALDDLIDKIQVETDKAKRDALIGQALANVKDDIPTIPLHQQAVVWATRDTISLTQLADNFFPFRYVTVK